MADQFLSKIRVSQSDFVDAGGRPVLERYDELKSLLADRAGPGVADLFAEPLISRGNDTAPPTVSWYADVAGDARPLSSLSGPERDRAEAHLADHLRPLRAMTEDPTSQDLALGALTVFGQDDVVVADGRPVIVNWGLMPDANGANASARPAHYEETLGRYVSLTAQKTGGPAAAGTVPPAAGAAAAATGAAAMAAGAGGGGTAGQPPGAPGEPPDREPSRISAIAWVPLLVLLILAGLILWWLLTPGTRLFHTALAPPAVTEESALKAARALNDSLREREATLRTALDGAVCRPDGVVVLPGGLTPEGLTPPPVGQLPEEEASVAPNSLLPNSTDRVLVPDPAGGDQQSLLNMIEARTVLVLAPNNQGGLHTGSGFAIGPDLIVTNYHVIDDVGDQGIVVTSKALGRPHQAQVVKSLGPLTETGADFALLRIDGANLPVFPIHVPQQSLRLTNVIASGFPGDMLQMDVDFAALKSGDVSAVPALTVTDGTVNTEQKIGPATHILMHSAPLSGGNSGGPLVDMCGRVVGVNTFVRKGKLQNRNFALATGDLMAFLQGTVANPSIVNEPCAPRVQTPQVATAPDAPADKAPEDKN